MALNCVLANIVWVLHILFVVFVIYAPFSSHPQLVVMHAITIPFVCFHWMLANDTCCLTLCERWLRGCEAKESFFHNLVSPVYNAAVPGAGISDETLSKWIWAATLLLWSVSAVRLARNPDWVRRAFFPAAAAKSQAPSSADSVPMV